MKAVLKGGRVIDPSQNIDAELDIIIENGKIVELAQDIPCSGTNEDTVILDLKDMIVTPGLIDMHTHLREPGFEYKETIQTGAEAAVVGGFTSIVCMANTQPVNDCRAVTEFIRSRAQAAGWANVYPVATLSKGMKGEILAEFRDLQEGGAVAVSDDGLPVMNALLMRNALEYASSLGLSVISHCEDIHLVADGLMNEGLPATELGLKGIPSLAEEIMVARDVALAGYTRTAVHIAHVSTAGSVDIIRKAKQKGIHVSAETAPHYFSLTDEALRTFSTNCKMNPPLRSAKDVQAIKEGLADGTIDAIASDHAPHSSIEKDLEFQFAANGIVGLETSLALGLKLVTEGVLSLRQLVERMSTTPANILKIPKGTLQKGFDADITVIDLNKQWTVDIDLFRSKSRNSPFNAWKFKGKAVMTIVGGIIKYDDR